MATLQQAFDAGFEAIKLFLDEALGNFEQRLAKVEGGRAKGMAEPVLAVEMARIIKARIDLETKPLKERIAQLESEVRNLR